MPFNTVPFGSKGAPLSGGYQPVYGSDGSIVGYKPVNTSGISTKFINSVSPYAATSSNSATSEAGRTLSPQQQGIFDLLQQFSTTGKYGDLFKAGDPYTGALGNYAKSALESGAQAKALTALEGGMPASFGLANTELQNLFSGEYDPYSETGVFSGFKKSVEKEAQTQADALNRRLSITGDLYATEGLNQQGLLAQNTQDTLANKLAELYDTYSNKRFQGIGLAADLGIAEENINQNRIQTAMEAGQLDRQLADQEAKDKLAEFTRSRSEFQATLDTAQTLLNQRIDSTGSSGGSTGTSQTSGSSAAGGGKNEIGGIGYKNVSGSQIPYPDWSDRASVQKYERAVSAATQSAQSQYQTNRTIAKKKQYQNYREMGLVAPSINAYRY